MNQIHQVDPKGKEIQVPLTLDQVLDLGVVLDQTPQQRTRVMKPHQTMSPVTKRKAENLQTSKWTAAWVHRVTLWSRAWLLLFFIKKFKGRNKNLSNVFFLKNEKTYTEYDIIWIENGHGILSQAFYWNRDTSIKTCTNQQQQCSQLDKNEKLKLTFFYEDLLK